MAYQSLYRRYRPQRFSELKGQDHVVRALRNAAAQDRLGHAYLFSGPRGTGKTSTARILAKVLNCEQPDGGEPCGSCEPCRAIEAGTSFDVTEIDAASTRKIDDIRDLIGTTALATPGRTRLYILDEVHQLTKDASAALLKTLEEPPEHVVFVLATTDPHMVLPTIRSRTQHLEFNLLPAEALTELVSEVANDAELGLDDAAARQAVRDGAGSARDTLSALDRIVAGGGVEAGDEMADALMGSLCEHDTGASLMALDDAVTRGRDPRVVGEQLLARLRDAFLTAMGGDVGHLTEADRARAADEAERLRPPAITRALEAVGEALIEMRQAADPRIPLEVALVRLTRPETDPSPAALLERIERLERKARSAGDGPSPADSARESLQAAETPDAALPPAEAEPASKPTLGAHRRAADGRPSEAAPPVDRDDQPARSEAAVSTAEPPASEASPPARSEAAVSTAEPPASEASPPAPEAPAPAVVGRDALTLAWGDTVLDQLRPKLKALFAAGRFLESVDGRAVFALPNEAHRKRCEEMRPDIERALAKYFGQEVEVTLVVDDGSSTVEPAPAGAARPTTEGEELSTEDVRGLEDAGGTATRVDQLAEVFGSVEAVDDEATGGRK